MGGTGDSPVPVGDPPTGSAGRPVTFCAEFQNEYALPFRPAGRRTAQASGLCYPPPRRDFEKSRRQGFQNGIGSSKMKLLEILLSSDFLKFAIPAAGAIIAWFVNERRKVRWEQYQRKEERYKELLNYLKGFYAHSRNTDMKAKFVDQVHLCWLYAPDEVIRCANAFLDTFMASRIPLATDEEKKNALGEFILAIRKDMLNRRLITTTSLTRSDWKDITVT